MPCSSTEPGDAAAVVLQSKGEVKDSSKTTAGLVIAGRELFDIAKKGVVLSGMGLSSIQLDGIATIDQRQLRQLSLASNALETIDLAPLSICSRLESLMLNGNRISKLDLTPLSTCAALEKLWIHDNDLTSIDLDPLATCWSLKSLYLDRNKIKTQADINLSPLAKCRLLRSVRLGGNPFQGPLDVTGILTCVSLSILDVPSPTQLVAVIQTAGGVAHGAPLPPALRKHNVSLKWIHPAPAEKSTPKCPTLLNALLVGFSKKATIAMDNLFKASGLVCTSVQSGQPFNDLMESNTLGKYHVCLLTPLVEEQLVTLQAKDPSLPLAVIGNEMDCGDSISRCLRRGAECFFTEPLGSRAVVSIRQLAEGRAKVAATNDALENIASQRPNLSRSRSCPAALLMSSDRSISFEKIRLRHLRKMVKGAPMVRSRFEENSLAVTFTRAGGIVNDNEFGLIASLCGLPSCSSSLLFDCATRRSQSNPVRKEIGVSGLDYDSFSEYFGDNFRDVDPETRLYCVLKDDETPYVRSAALERIVGPFLRPDDFLSLPSSVFECEKQRRTLISLAASLLAFAIAGRSASISLYQIRQAKLGSALISAEAGVFDGVMQSLRPERILRALREYAEATDSSDITTRLNRADLIRFCHMKRTLTAGAAGRLVDKLGLQGSIDICEYGRMESALSNPTCVSSTRYMFDLADSDSDGILGVGDVAELFMEKKEIMGSQGVKAIDFPVVCRWINEMLQMPHGGDADACAIRPRHFKNARVRDLDGLWRALLYIEDDMVLANLREGASGQPSGLVPGSFSGN